MTIARAVLRLAICAPGERRRSRPPAREAELDAATEDGQPGDPDH